MDYCRPENTVIVACFCCNDDMENQAVHRLARDLDESGKRTVGVLTKPDLIQEGSEDTWVSVFRNEKYPLAKGYYVVRNRTQKELEQKVSRDQSARIETAFFQEHRIGSRFPQACMDRCGGDQLRTALSRLLKAKIDEQLPDLYDQLAAKYDKSL